VEDCLDQIAANMHRFYDERVAPSQAKRASQKP